MDETKKEETVVDDEAELDKELNDQINAVKAGNKLEPTAQVKAEEKVEEKPVEPAAPAPETKVEDPSKPPVAEEEEKGYEFRIPNKGKFESDESFELRIKLLDQVKRRKTATTPEAKAALSEDIQKTKGQLKNLNGADKIINPLNKSVAEPKIEEEDPALKADRERLKELGGATKEDVAEMVKQERQAGETKSTLENFINRHPAEFKDEDVREVFFDFVDTNYNWKDKSSKELMTILELARENMFKPSESIQERVLKGANVAEKVNAMQFPGGTVAKGNYSPDMKKSIDELVATGMSEEKAVELLSE